jgi:hypothetical protein
MNSEELFTNLRKESISSSGIGSKSCSTSDEANYAMCVIEARLTDPPKTISQSSIRRTAEPQPSFSGPPTLIDSLCRRQKVLNISPC